MNEKNTLTQDFTYFLPSLNLVFMSNLYVGINIFSSRKNYWWNVISFKTIK